MGSLAGADKLITGDFVCHSDEHRGISFLLLYGDTGRFVFSMPIVITCSLVASRLVLGDSCCGRKIGKGWRLARGRVLGVFITG